MPVLLGELVCSSGRPADENGLPCSSEAAGRVVHAAARCGSHAHGYAVRFHRADPGRAGELASLVGIERSEMDSPQGCPKGATRGEHQFMIVGVRPATATALWKAFTQKSAFRVLLSSQASTARLFQSMIATR